MQTNTTSCIDLIFTQKLVLSVDPGVHSSLHPNCPQHVNYSTFNLYIGYPQPYQRPAQDYKKDDPNKTLSLSKLGETICSKRIDAQVATFNDTILNSFRNFVPNK